jgi:hypothetical protein
MCSVKDPQLALSVVIKNDDYINFKAADRKTASYWLDALNLLLGMCVYFSKPLFCILYFCRLRQTKYLL